MKFLVIGAGKQGTACAFDLLQRPATERVVLADRDLTHLPAFLDSWKGGALALERLDLQDEKAVAVAVGGVDAVLSAAPYYFNFELARAAVKAGVHFADLGGNTEIVVRQRTLGAEAEKRGVSVIPDCGLAPGMVNILAAEGIRRLDETDSVKIFVGGLPQKPEPPLNYMVVYSLEGAFDYYTSPSWVLRDGKRTQVEPLSEIEHVVFPDPIGKLEAFHTGGGISTLPFTWEGRIRTMEYKTLRYPGHVAIMKPIRELGLLGTDPVEVNGTRVRPRDAFIAIVSPRLTKPEGRDLVALMVDVRGRKGGRPAASRWQMVDRYDAKHHVTAMMRTTGYSLAITGLLQLDGRITARGVRTPDECVPAGPYVEELAKRGIVVEETRQ
ncbi:MAG TPA: saccharopine dehydrogenase C-terminal domain-containing protein [Gemmatimonadales bacterium]|nr:saccharopine dehydrogenase C-terminal domain-containing protein [Gemmatimonadales bacterium]